MRLKILIVNKLIVFSWTRTKRVIMKKRTSEINGHIYKMSRYFPKP